MANLWMSSTDEVPHLETLQLSKVKTHGTPVARMQEACGWQICRGGSASRSRDHTPKTFHRWSSMNYPTKMHGAPVACTQEVAKLDQKQTDALPEASTTGVPPILWVVLGLRGGVGPLHIYI